MNGHKMASQPVRDFIVLTPYPVEPNHTLITIARIGEADWRPEMEASATLVRKNSDGGIIINKHANIMDYNRAQAGQKERQQPPSAKMSFKVFLNHSETNKLSLEHRTLRFWLDFSTLLRGSNNNNLNDDDFKSARTFANIRQESSQIAQDFFCQLIGTKPDEDFPKRYVDFIMKLMRLLGTGNFKRISKMEVEMRQLAYDEQSQQHSRIPSIDSGSQSGESSGRGSPLTSQKVLDIIESSYPNPISIKEICSTTQTEETIVRQFVTELAQKDKINSTDNGQHFTRKLIDTKINLVKQMPKVNKSQQPVIAIITAQYCEKLAVDAMISDKQTFVRYKVTTGQEGSGAESAAANYVYTLGNIGDHRVVSTKLTSVGHSRGALIAAGNATTRLLGTFPEIEYVFLVGCGGSVPNYTNFDLHVRLGDVVVSHTLDCNADLRPPAGGDPNLFAYQFNGNKSPSDYVYVHCRPREPQQESGQSGEPKKSASLPVSYSIHKNLKKVANGSLDKESPPPEAEVGQKLDITAPIRPIAYNECHFRLWRPAKLDLQELAQRLWEQGLEAPQHRVWEHHIDEGIKALKQQDIDASRPPADTDKLFMSTIEVSHPEAGENELDLRREGRPMCHFGPIGSGRPALANETLKQEMVRELGLRAFDSEFDPVVESIYGNRKESYIFIRGISDYRDGRKKKEWQQYSALVAAAFMKSVIVNLKPLN